jgi:hypothetical protein
MSSWIVHLTKQKARISFRYRVNRYKSTNTFVFELRAHSSCFRRAHGW